MSLLKTIFASTLILSVAGLAQAQDDIDTIEAIETVPSKKLQTRGQHIRGPVTSLYTAGLMLAGFDKNTDYSVTRAEFDAGRIQAFEIADKDKSGALGLFELEDWRQKVLGSLDAPPGNLAFDKNYDQRVTRTEFDTVLGHIFKRADKNEDGRVISSELIHVFEMPYRPVSNETRRHPETLNDAERNRHRR